MHTTHRGRREERERGEKGYHLCKIFFFSMDMAWKVLGGYGDGLADDEDDDEEAQVRRRKGEDKGRRMIRKRERGQRGEGFGIGRVPLNLVVSLLSTFRRDPCKRWLWMWYGHREGF